MDYNDFGTGEGEFFDFDNDGKLDIFEQALMLNEQDRECREMFHGDSSRGDGGGNYRYLQSNNKKSTTDDAKLKMIAAIIVAVIYILAKLFE